ncbi:MAG: prolipoprotein diacylglyceryl transferase [Bacilli bacterium]
MNRYLLEFSFIKISWYSIFIVLGVLIGSYILTREAKKFKIQKEFISNMIFWALIIGIIGARAYYVVFNWSYYSQNIIDIFKVWEGGLAIHGGIIAGAIFVLFYSRKYQVNTWKLFDMITPAVLIGQAIGRWGNFFNQEAHGLEVSRSFLESLYIPNFIIEGVKIQGVYYHPTFLYESVLCLTLFILLLIIRKFYKYLKNGQLIGLYLMFYSLGRFFIESLRTDSLMFNDLKTAQIVSIILFVLGLIIVSVRSLGSRFDNRYREVDREHEVRF